MKGYCIFDNVSVSNPEKLGEYKTKAELLVEKFGGKYLILGGEHKVVEGNYHPNFVVIIEFPTYQIALDWYNSKEYQEIIHLRTDSVVSNGVIIRGI